MGVVEGSISHLLARGCLEISKRPREDSLLTPAQKVDLAKSIKKRERQIKQLKAKAKGFWKQHVLIQRLLVLIQFRDIKKDVEANTLLINHPLESMIRQNQGQWFAPEVGIKKKVCSR